MWNRSDDDQPQNQPQPRTGAAPGSGGRATIGSSIAVQGKLAGKEDLLIEGRFEGEIRVPGHQVTIGRQGSVEAEVRARLIVVEGKLSGNIVAEEQAVVRASGKVEGDIKAPKVALDEGCQFKGRIDMEPAEGKAAVEASKKESRDESKPGEPGQGLSGSTSGSGSSRPEGRTEGSGEAGKSAGSRPGESQEADRKRA